MHNIVPKITTVDSDLFEVLSSSKGHILHFLKERLLLPEGEQLLKVAACLLVLHLDVGLGNHEESGGAAVHHQVPGMGYRTLICDVHCFLSYLIFAGCVLACYRLELATRRN